MLLQLLRFNFKNQFGLFSDVIMVILVLFICFILFPFAITFQQGLMLKFLPAVIWIPIILLIINPINILFKNDFNSGLLQKLFMGSNDSFSFLVLYVLAKNITLIMVYGLCISFFVPIFSLLFYIKITSYMFIFCNVFIGICCLVFIGSMINCIVISIKKRNLLLPVLILPMYIPVIIFATSSLNDYLNNLSYINSFMLLLSYTIFSFVISPLIGAKILHISLQEH